MSRVIRSGQTYTHENSQDNQEFFIEKGATLILKNCNTGTILGQGGDLQIWGVVHINGNISGVKLLCFESTLLVNCQKS